MKLLHTLTISLVLAGSSAALAETKKPAKEEISAADAEKFLVFFNKFADAVIQNKDNCPKMATSISGVIDTNQDTIKKANEAKAANKKLPKAVEEKLTARLKDMFPAMVKCKDDAGVKAAMKRMEGPSSKASKQPAKP